MDLIYYNGEHSMSFGGKNSWTDWHLIPTSKPVISPPTVKTKQVDIPGTNGLLDISMVLTGYSTYSNRTGTLDFILAPGFDSWETTKTNIMSHLHGRSMNLYLSDDPDHYYTGMFYVNSFKSDARVNGLSINYDLYPFKRDVIDSTEDWLWDPFNFETGVIRGWNSLVVSGSLELTVDDCMEPVRPIVTASAAMTLAHTYYLADGVTTQTKTYNIAAGTSTPGFILRPGENTLLFTGDGTVTISYRGGTL